VSLLRQNPEEIRTGRAGRGGSTLKGKVELLMFGAGALNLPRRKLKPPNGGSIPLQGGRIP